MTEQLNRAIEDYWPDGSPHFAIHPIHGRSLVEDVNEGHHHYIPIKTANASQLFIACAACECFWRRKAEAMENSVKKYKWNSAEWHDSVNGAVNYFEAAAAWALAGMGGEDSK